MKNIKILYLSLIVFSFFTPKFIFSQENLKENDYVTERKSLSYKIFPLISWIDNNANVMNTLLSSKENSQIRAKKYQKIIEYFKENPFKYLPTKDIVSDFRFSEEEIKNALLFLSNLDNLHNEIKNIMNLPQYTYKEHHDVNDFLENTLRNELIGINKIIDRYALAVDFKYKKIDSVKYNTKSEYYNKIINLNTLNILDSINDKTTFYKPSLEFALSLLEANNRDESIRFEPMEKGENKKALEKISTTKWDNYPYSVLLIPGHGPEEKGVSLSPLGILRCKLAADRYHKGLAPFIILSGGYVHPFQTPYCEAIEMKKELMNKYNIPEDAIIIEPHARHTTTNFRNAARLIFKYNIPHDKKALCSTTKDQSYYITHMDFDQRCLNELGYIPYKLGERLNRNDVEFYPLIESLYIDNDDPLDP